MRLNLKKSFLILLLFLFLFPTLVGCQDLKWIAINNFSGGLNDDISTWELQPNECSDILNCYVDDIQRGISKRKGYVKANSTEATSQYWIQTSSTDWVAGALVNIDTYTATGTYRLETSYWTQTSAADFSTMTLVNIDTETVSGTFRTMLSDESVEQEYTTGGDADASNYKMSYAQSFKPSINCILTKVKVYVKNQNSASTTYWLRSDDNNSPGDTLQSKVISPGASYSWVDIDFTDQELTANTRYWLSISGSYPATIYWRYDSSGASYPNGNYWDAGSGNDTDKDFLFKIYEQHYESPSSLISQIGDLKIKPESWGNFVATVDLNGRTIDWEIQTSSNSNMSNPTGWVSVENNTIPSVTLNRYAQWKSILNASSFATPVVYDVTINGKVTGSLTSQSHDCTEVVQWGRLEANVTLNGQTIVYAVRTSSFSAGLSSATWYAVESGNNIIAPVNQYVQWISTLTSTGSQTPIVNNVTIYWYSAPTSIFDKPITSLHTLTKSDGSKYMWAVSTDTIYGSADASLFASVKSGMSTIYDVNWANMVDAAYCVDGSTYCQKFTAYDSCTAATEVPRGRFIIEEGYRLWVGYAVGEPNKLYYETNLNDATEWDWVYIPGEGEITGLGKLQGSVIVYKPTSVWKVIGIQVSTQENVYFVPTLVNLSSEAGCINHRSIQNFRLKERTVQLFLGIDNVYATNGVTVVPVGDNIENTIEDLKQATFASSYSWLETNFFDGTSTNIDTTTVLGTIRLEMNNYEETTSTHFVAGVTKTNIDTADDELKLQISDEAINQQCTETFDSDNYPWWRSDLHAQAQSFRINRSCKGTKVIIAISREIKYDDISDLKVYLKKGTHNSIGTTIASKTIPKGDVSENDGEKLPADKWVTVDLGNVSLEKDAYYWIYIPKTGDEDDHYLWDKDWDNPYSRGGGWVSDYPLSPDGFIFLSDKGFLPKCDAFFKFHEQHYPTTGQFRSQVKDLGENCYLGNFYESHSGSGLTFKVRAFTTEWDSWKTIQDGDATGFSGNKVQYNIDFTSTKGYLTPEAHDVKIEYIKNDGTGNFISSINDCGVQIAYWGDFIANSILNNQSVSYEVRTSSYSAGINNATWYDVFSGGLISAIVNRYVQWKTTLTTTNGTEIPIVNDVTIYWWAGEFSGSSPASVVYDDRYHLFAMTSDSDFNNIDLVLNGDGAWTKNDIEADSATIYDRHLYTGSSTTTAYGSWIYEQDIGYSDDLQPINAYWQSKDYDLGIPYKNKILRKIWVTTKRVGDHSLNLTYTMDLNRKTQSYDIDLSQGYAPIIGDEKHCPATDRAKFFNFRVSNAGENEPFELYRIDAGFQKAPGISEP